jgi:hypothetical protein
VPKKQFDLSIESWISIFSQKNNLGSQLYNVINLDLNMKSLIVFKKFYKFRSVVVLNEDHSQQKKF